VATRQIEKEKILRIQLYNGDLLQHLSENGYFLEKQLKIHPNLSKKSGDSKIL
jgi:hypothetical protein